MIGLDIQATVTTAHRTLGECGAPELAAKRDELIAEAAKRLMALLPLLR